MLETAERQSYIRRVTWIGAVLDGILGIIKIVVGWLVNSPALIADGFHSFSDLLTDIGVVIFSHWAQHEPDEDHPYGHQRYETLGTVILGTSLVVLATAIAWDSIVSIFYQTHVPQPSVLAMLIALLSILSKEWIFRFTLHASKKVNSKLLEANAWHSRSDAFSSIIVLFGVIATWLGYAQLELVAAIFVAFLIGKMGVRLTWDASQDLIDRGIEADEIQKIEETIRSISGIIDVHMLRSRMMGNHAYLDVHIQVGEKITVSEGHYISEQVVHVVKAKHPLVHDITVHVDYEDDLNEPSKTIELPNREAIVQSLRNMAINTEKIQIHYLSNKVVLELFFRRLPSDLRTITKNMDNWRDREPWLESYFIYQGV